MTDDRRRVGAYRVVKQVWDGDAWRTRKILRGPVMPDKQQERAVDSIFDALGDSKDSGTWSLVNPWNLIFLLLLVANIIVYVIINIK